MTAIHIDHDTFNKYHCNGKIRLTVGYIQEALEKNGYPGHDGVVQIVKGKRDVGEQCGHKFTYRIRIHDGVFQYNTLLSADIDDQIERETEDLVEGSIIAITDFVIYSQGSGVKNTFLITGYKLLSRYHSMLNDMGVKARSHSGNPDEHKGYRPSIILEDTWPEAESLSGDFTENMTNPPAAKVPKHENGADASHNRAAAPEPPRRAAPPVARKVASKTEGTVVPIGMITPYIQGFKVHGQVTRKDPIRTIPAKNMKIFNFELTDTHGDTIRFTAFNELAESVHDTLSENGSYFITGGTVRQANKQYNNTGHDYEITLRNDSIIEAGGEVLAAPKLVLKRVMLSEISSHAGAMIDVLAIVEKIDAEPTSFTSKQGKDLVKREMELIDQSKALVRLTLWGDEATNARVDEFLHKVVAFKGVIPREFNGGFSLGTGNGTRIVHVPELDGVMDLYDWYTTEKPNAELKMMSVTFGGSNAEAPRTIAGIQEMQFGKDNDKGEYVNVKAMITRINGTNALYKGCASEGCQKKVNDNDGEYRCEKCQKSSSSFKWLYMMQFELSDETGQVYVTAFGDNASKIVGTTAAELGEMKDSDPEGYEAIFERLQFTPKMWRLRCKMETYNEEVRQKMTVFNVEEVNQDRYIEQLKQLIEQMQDMKDEVF